MCVCVCGPLPQGPLPLGLRNILPVLIAFSPALFYTLSSIPALLLPSPPQGQSTKVPNFDRTLASSRPCPCSSLSPRSPRSPPLSPSPLRRGWHSAVSPRCTTAPLFSLSPLLFKPLLGFCLFPDKAATAASPHSESLLLRCPRAAAHSLLVPPPVLDRSSNGALLSELLPVTSPPLEARAVSRPR